MMEQQYHRWPFLPANMRPMAQADAWWQDCFVTVGPIERFVHGVGSTAVMSRAGDGGSTAVAYMMRCLKKKYLLVTYPGHHWPQSERPRVPGKGHIGQIMALLATEVAACLENEPERYTAVGKNLVQQEFLCWLLEKYVGRRALVRLAQRLQQRGDVLAVPTAFVDVYPSDELEADVWNQISEAGELAEAMGFEKIVLVIDVNSHEQYALLDDLIDLVTRLDLLEHPLWLIRAAVPDSELMQQLLERSNGRLHRIRLGHTVGEIEQIVDRYVACATDGRRLTLASLWDTAVGQRAAQEIELLYGRPSLAGWLDWAETALHLIEVGQVKPEGVLTNVDEAVFMFYKRHVLLQLDEARQGVWRGPQFVSLEGQPYELMKKLFMLRGRPSPDALYEVAGSVANLNTMANRLRQKIEPLKGKTNVYLLNQRDKSYWLENFKL